MRWKVLPGTIVVATLLLGSTLIPYFVSRIKAAGRAVAIFEIQPSSLREPRFAETNAIAFPVVSLFSASMIWQSPHCGHW